MIKQKFFLALPLLLLNCIACSNTASKDLGVGNGKLLSCPGSPNCVSSQSDDDLHRVEPIRYLTTSHEAQQKLLTILDSMKRTTIIKTDDNYIHATCTSFLLRFVDDVEFAIDDTTKTIHIRSASRLGYYDFGANRKRVGTISKHFLGS